MALKIAVFPTRNQAGHKIEEGCRMLAAELFGRSAKVGVHLGASPFKFMKTSFLSDVMILDSTVGPVGENNYYLSPGMQRLLDHVLVVSRSYLPMNVRGKRIHQSLASG